VKVQSIESRWLCEPFGHEIRRGTSKESHKWKSQPYRQAPGERSAMEALVFTLKEGFEFGEMALEWRGVLMRMC
jgi:hypothetical protein